ncbi:MAG: ABC transporter ATP-binding protein [Coprobacillus sp.]
MCALIQFKNIVKSYVMGDVTINASDGVDFEVNKGEFVVIVGASGAGKTTILNLLGGMDSPTSGSILVDGENIALYDEKKLTEYRRNDIGFVFQFYNLVQNLTALENVELSTQISKNPLDPQNVLERVGLDQRMMNFPAQMSGGEQQRVAIARAIAKNPKLLLCDEPTGALDYQTGKSILALLREMCELYDMTVIVITHNSALAPMADRIIHLRNGKVYGVEMNQHPKSIEEIEW